MLSCFLLKKNFGWHLDIQIDEPFRDQVEEDRLRRVAEATLSPENVDSPIALSLLITDDETVHHLNQTYRGIDQTTDVLAFAFQDDLEQGSFPLSPDGLTQLGEVIISYPKTVDQAKQLGHPTEDELTILLIHGILHLLGYDHQLPDQENLMKVKEIQILSNLRES